MPLLRKKLYHILEEHSQTPRLSAYTNRFLIVLICINVTAASLETVASLKAEYNSLFLLIERFSIAIFTVEYAIRLWVSAENPDYKNRLAYITSSNAIIDAVSIIPFYIALAFHLDVKIFILLRLLRLLKLVRYFEPLSILGRALKAEFTSFMSALFILFMLIMIASTGMYLFEKDAQPELFGSIPQSMWWSVVTLTTLGYGDVVLVTIAGKIFAGMITILSIGTVALPAGMLASRFSEELKERKQSFKTLASSLQKDGHLCNQSLKKLEAYRIDACLSKEDAENLIAHAQNKGSTACPHCGSQPKH